MQHYAIVLGGLERVYMQKLALYLRERLDISIQVEILEDGSKSPVFNESDCIIWAGSEQFIRQKRSVHCAGYLLTLTEEKTDQKDSIFRYQSCEKIYRNVFSCCKKMGGYNTAGGGAQNQRWTAVTSDGAVGSLLAFSMVCAQIFGERERVLYVNLLAYSGMAQLLSLEKDVDLSDLFLDMRKGRESSLELYVGRLEQMDYLLPPENPMILQEITQEEMQRFLDLIAGAKQYDRVVFAVGGTVCGCNLIFRACSHIFHLTKPGILHDCSRASWLQFLKLCREEENNSSIVQVDTPVFPAEYMGIHLLSDWREGAVGRLAEQRLREEGELDDTVAGNPR